MSAAPRILLISFFFPPFNRVGGRRWAKHAKYLHRLGIPVFVLAGNYSGHSPWDLDIRPFEKNISRIDHKALKKPFFQSKLPANFMEKLRWKLSYYAWQMIKPALKGNYNDSSLGNDQAYLKKAEEIIRKEAINTVILSAGPFFYSRILTQLKAEFPHLKTVLDYRDYWEDGFAGLSQAQVEQEVKAQEAVIGSVDLVLSPNREMQQYYAAKFGKPSYLLPHCIDPEDLVNIKPHKPRPVLKLVYGGAFYKDIENNISLIRQFVDRLSQSRKTEADFYVSVKGYEKELQHPAIHRFDFIESALYFDKVSQADYVILILPPNRVNAMSSKFFELVASRKPILYFGGKGDVSDYIIQNNLGFHITAENLAQQAALCISNLETQAIPDLSYDISGHTFRHQTRAFINQLQTLC